MSCGAGTDREWYLDLGEDRGSLDEIMNTIYLCNLCLTAAAKDKNLVDQSPLLARIEDLETEVFNYKTKAEALEHGLDDLIRARIFDSGAPAYRDLRDLLQARDQADGGSQEPGSDVSGVGGAAPEPGPGPNLGAVPAGFSFDGGAA